MKRTAITMLVIMALGALILPACKGGAKPASGLKVYEVGKDAVQLTLLEQGSDCLSYWLKNKDKDRVLVRFSGFDGLAPVSDVAMKAIKGAADKGDFDALKQMGDALKDNSLYASDNAVYLAHRLGIIREVYWVVPTFGSFTQEDLDAFKESLKKSYPSQAAEIDALKLDGKMAGGSINGVPVKIVGLQDMKGPGEPVLLDTDVSYLASLYAGEKETRVLPLFEGFFRLVRDAGIKSDQVSLTASNSDGKVPVKFRFAVKYLTTLYGYPNMVDGEPPSLWSQRSEAWRVEQKNPKLSIPLYESITKQFPDDAASHYDLSAVYFGQGDLVGCKRELAEAIRYDKGYAAGYIEFAKRLAASGKGGAAKEFVDLAIVSRTS